jgi:hypothetical protein
MFKKTLKVYQAIYQPVVISRPDNPDLYLKQKP